MSRFKNNMASFSEAAEPIMQQFAKRRISTFAKKHNVGQEDVEIVNEIPIEQLEKEFKRNNNIRTRLYKNLNEEQQQAWKLYYNDHKQLSLKVKENIVAQQEPPKIEEKQEHKRKTKNTEKVVEQIESTPETEEIEKPAEPRKHKKHHTKKTEANSN